MSEDRLHLAREALQRGELVLARKLVAKVLLSDPTSERGWLMMARLVSNREQVIECLERASKINPTNLATMAALQAMKRKKIGQEKTPDSFPAIYPSETKPETPGKPAYILESTSLQPGVFAVPATHSEEPIRQARHKLNLPLIFGALIVVAVILAAFFGPQLAPQDPMKQHAVIEVGGQWIRPPFNAFQVPGFPLGSDVFGRDMLSRILYAIRPTLVMVSIVAAVRLTLGTLIGLGAGWSRNRLSTALDGLVSAALSVPVMLVALGGIAMIDAKSGIWAFIFGLSINGWGETARFVREQVRLVKGQLYIESARSLGASSRHILTHHVLRQIKPMVWMLFAFEISSTLMVTAGLGFLGYYIGGDVWIDIADFLSQRTSGAPELGQMLATSWSNLLQAWPLVLTGFIIFVIVFGFNLLGQGLILRLSPEFVNRNSAFSRLQQRTSRWYEESVQYPVSNWLRANRLRPALVLLVVVLLPASFVLYKDVIADRLASSHATLGEPGKQVWSAEKVDPYASYYYDSIGPTNPALMWTVSHPAGFSGSPVVSADGTVYAAGLDGKLLAINPDGTTRWQADLSEQPAGPLALGTNGTIFITDIGGGLSAFDPQGTLLWKYSVQLNGTPNHGPIVDLAGNIYYLLETNLGDTLIAVKPDGSLLWSINPGTQAASTGLRLSPDGKQLFVQNVIVNVEDGSSINLNLPGLDNALIAKKAHLITGADGKTYFLVGQDILQWAHTSQGIGILKKISWDYHGVGSKRNTDLPLEAGSTPEGILWLFYTGDYSGTSLYRLDTAGNVLGSFVTELSKATTLVAIDRENTAYTCGIGFSYEQGVVTLCEAYRQDASTPSWSLLVDPYANKITGAAMAPGRLYVLTPGGNLVALGDPGSGSTASTVNP